MKKLSYLFLGLAGLTMASCSQDDLKSPSAGNDGHYVFTVSLPKSMGSRAIGDGSAATTLYVWVYDDTDQKNYVTALEPKAFENGNSTTVELDLVAGIDYNIAFFAAAPDAISTFTNTTSPSTSSVYNINTDNGELTVNYDAMDSDGNLADSYDCFYANLSTSDPELNTNVMLYRPVAQVNWGTNDLTKSTVQALFGGDSAAATLENITTSLQVNGVPETLNLLDDTVTGSQNVQLKAFSAPQNEDGEWPGEWPGTGDYNYLAMQYLLVDGASSNNYTLTLTINNAKDPNAVQSVNDIDVVNAPLQANFQTNIYGALLTETNSFTVTKSEIWGGSILAPQEMGDPVLNDEGEAVDGLYLNDATKTYTITTTDGLEYYAENIAVATKMNDGLSGYTVLLGNDLQMQGVPHTPFYNAGATFDGQGHTIYDLSVDLSNSTTRASAGFMAAAKGIVQNINFENANIKSNFKAGVLAGDGMCAYINNINVNGSTIISTPWQPNGAGDYDDGNNAGGIVGYLSGEPKASLTNCTVTNSSVTAYRTVGAIVGRALSYTSAGAYCNVENNTAKNVVVTANQYIPNGTYAEPDKAIAAGEIYGENTNNTATIQNNTSSNVSVIIINSDNNVAITSVQALQSIADAVNSGENQFTGQTLVLSGNLDLSGVNWTPIGTSQYPFQGNFDGGNNTISNLTINSSSDSNVGLFGFTEYLRSGSGTTNLISNLTIENATVNGNQSVGVLIGYAKGTDLSNITIKGDIQVSGSAFVGGVAGKGYFNMNGVTVEANSGSLVEATLASGESMVGGVVGHTGESTLSTGSYQSVKSNIDVTGALSFVGGVAGVANQGITFVNCSSTGNVTLTGATTDVQGVQIGGIAGGWVNAANTTVTFTGCTYSGGTLTSNMMPSGWDLATSNNIVGVAYLPTQQGTLIIGGSEVQSQHWQPTSN